MIHPQLSIALLLGSTTTSSSPIVISRTDRELGEQSNFFLLFIPFITAVINR
jgi:hypothetical protein